MTTRGRVWAALAIIFGPIVTAGAVFLYFVVGGLGYNALKYGSVEFDYRAVALQALGEIQEVQPIYDQISEPFCLRRLIEFYAHNRTELPDCAPLVVESNTGECSPAAAITVIPEDGPYPDEVFTTVAVADSKVARVAAFFESYSVDQAKRLGGMWGRSVVARKETSTRTCSGYGLIFMSQRAADIFEARKTN